MHVQNRVKQHKRNKIRNNDSNSPAQGVLRCQNPTKTLNLRTQRPTCSLDLSTGACLANRKYRLQMSQSTHRLVKVAPMTLPCLRLKCIAARNTPWNLSNSLSSANWKKLQLSSGAPCIVACGSTESICAQSLLYSSGAECCDGSALSGCSIGFWRSVSVCLVAVGIDEWLVKAPVDAFDGNTEHCTFLLCSTRSAFWEKVVKHARHRNMFVVQQKRDTCS